MKIRTLLILLLSLIILAVAAVAKKPTGKISDLDAFSRIHSYCVDSEDMPGDEALDLKNFVSTESKPKKLLSKLPWTLAPECSPNSPDAVIKVEFSQYFPVRESQVGSPTPDSGPAQEEFYKVRAVLRVSQPGSSPALYEVEAAPLSNSLTGHAVVPVDEPLPVQRHNAIYGAFWKLIDDVHRVAPAASKQ
jgi:hypothetical protein